MTGNERRKNFVKDMIRESWIGYFRFNAQRARRLYMESHKGWFGRDPVRNTIASMGILWITENNTEFAKAEDFVKQKLDVYKLDDENIVSFFISDYIGGLLEVYALSGRKWYLDKAKDIALHIKKAYSSPSGKSQIDLTNLQCLKSTFNSL